MHKSKYFIQMKIISMLTKNTICIKTEFKNEREES